MVSTPMYIDMRKKGIKIFAIRRSLTQEFSEAEVHNQQENEVLLLFQF